MYSVIGIVGSEEAKFTEIGRNRAFSLLTSLLSDTLASIVVSGGCHLGGIDKWAIQVGCELGLTPIEFLPEKLSWAEGYRQRNLEIAQASDIVHCITVDKLPPDFKGMRFSHCYHCNSTDHVKSGGCWTMKQAIKLGKVGQLHVINNY